MTARRHFVFILFIFFLLFSVFGCLLYSSILCAFNFVVWKFKCVYARDAKISNSNVLFSPSKTFCPFRFQFFFFFQIIMYPYNLYLSVTISMPDKWLVSIANANANDVQNVLTAAFVTSCLDRFVLTVYAD